MNCSLVSQFLHYLTYLLHCGESGRDERQSQDILYHSHFAEHCFHASRIAIDEKQLEKELKDALLLNIQSFLLELGTGFAYLGKEYRLDVEGHELFLDMLFYHTKVHAFVVVEVKTTAFKPDYIGQLGTYVAAVDHLLKSDSDEKTIGILICKDKDNVLARYSLESSSKPLGISTYELTKLIPDDFKSSFPTIEEIEMELMQDDKKQDDDIQDEYDFSQGIKNPYAKKLKKQK